jgi:myo-inositol-1(or 4)-monophosphatase
VPDLESLLELSKRVALQAGSHLLNDCAALRDYDHSDALPKEVKAVADRVLESEILAALAPTGLAILSEESGYRAASTASESYFIVDPLDGTYNFVRELGPSAVSIALWAGERPLFGVICSLPDRKLAWGGSGLGAYIEGQAIAVSALATQARSCLCTGFPVRFDFSDPTAMQNFQQTAARYAKVRMFGSAAISLLQVARGAADVYWENSIMLWDVAAGLAITDGAGGRYALTKTSREWCYDVMAGNPLLMSGGVV